MMVDWYPGIKAFCAHWRHAPMLQQTLQALESEFEDDNDACIDAAKAMVECACRVIIDQLDDPLNRQKPSDTNATVSALVACATKLLNINGNRHRHLGDLIKHHNSLTGTLRELRNDAGPVSHGKDGFVSKLTTYHRRAAVLSADAIVTFLHEAYLELEPDPVKTQEPYDRFQEANDMIDRFATISATTNDDGSLNATILLPDGDELPLTVVLSRLLFGVDREAYKATLAACRDAANRANTEDEEGV